MVRGCVFYNEKTQLLDAAAIRRAVTRIAHEIVERNRGTDEIVLLGVRTRGVYLAQRLAQQIRAIEGHDIAVGSVDPSRYRDDERVSPSEQSPAVDVPTTINKQKVILIDDVLYTGRTVRAALDALIALGRPQLIQLAVLIDRGHRELPIRPDYVGKNVPTSRQEHVSVCLVERDGVDRVVLYERAEE